MAAEALQGIGAASAGLASAVALAALLGFRHGFDADHIAVVDAMTRTRQLHGSYWRSRWVGLQFAAGHSAAVLAAALLLYGLHGQAAALPAWLEGLGLAISVGLLLLIAGSNAAHALGPADGRPRPPGPLAALLFRVAGRQLHPLWVGVAFALSLDTMAQAAFFASQAGRLNGLASVACLALAFGSGMMLADAGNGALLAWCAGRSDRLARQASRFSSGFIAAIALATAAAAVLREVHAGAAQRWDAAGIWIGVALMALTTVVYGVRMAVQRSRSPAH